MMVPCVRLCWQPITFRGALGCSHMLNKTEIKQCRRWSAEIKQICFSFVSVLFQFRFTCASGLTRYVIVYVTYIAHV